MLHSAAIFDAEQSRAADKAAIASGISGTILMENAGKASADYITKVYSPCPALVICGTGNNGGDGFVVARLLRELGWPVELAVVGDAGTISGDAQIARGKWERSGGSAVPFAAALLKDKKLLVDALFGTGLARNVEGQALAAITAINESGVPVVSLDIPSGVNASTGAIMGAAVRAAHAVTFVRPKLGHMLLPGKMHVGTLQVVDIGIDDANLSSNYFMNVPPVWQHVFPRPARDTHKYARGHSLVIGGPPHSTGASRLAALAALRIGSGAVSIACSSESLPIYATALISVMTKLANTPTKLEALLEDAHTTAVVIGPGCGVNETTRERVLQILSHKKPCVLDADALTVFKRNPKSLFKAISGPVVMTPHEGEFARLFSFEGSKVQRALEAARQSNAVVVLKGNDTVIASPDGRAAININAPQWLATAGSGDVLAGLIAGLMAQGMPAWEAACAAALIHGETGNLLGPGTIAEDLPQAVPSVLKRLYER